VEELKSRLAARSKQEAVIHKLEGTWEYVVRVGYSRWRTGDSGCVHLPFERIWRKSGQKVKMLRDTGIYLEDCRGEGRVIPDFYVSDLRKGSPTGPVQSQKRAFPIQRVLLGMA
jgi:hypothetical protein